MRSPLIVTSVGFHIVVVSALLVAGLWKLERLEPGRREIDLAVAPSPPPPAASGSPAAAKAEPFKRKQRTVVKALVQPQRDLDAKPVVAASEPGLGTGGTGSGAGSGSGSEPDGTGSCVGDGCGPAGASAAVEPPAQPPAAPVVVPPTVIKGLRIAGETQVHPPAPVKTAILRDGRSKVTASFRVCVGTAGEVAGVTAVKPSGYAGYDGALEAALRDWRYRPYEIAGRRVAVCGIVTFIYSLQ